MPELEVAQWVMLAVVTLGAAIVQSATGFGFAVVSVPFFLIVLESLAAIQVNIVLNLFNALVVAPKIWRSAPAGILRPLIGGTLLGLPVGMMVFLYADLAHLKMAVAILIIVFAIQLITKAKSKPTSRTPSRPAALSVGGVSGGLTSALAMPGPPVLIYLAHFDLSKDEFRAVNLTLYIVSYGCALALQGTVGAMTLETWTLSAILIPLAAFGGVLGHIISPWLSPRAFRICVLATLLFTGVYMLYVALIAG